MVVGGSGNNECSSQIRKGIRNIVSLRCLNNTLRSLSSSDDDDVCTYIGDFLSFYYGHTTKLIVMHA